MAQSRCRLLEGSAMNAITTIPFMPEQEVLPPLETPAFLFQRSPFTSAVPVYHEVPEGGTLQTYADVMSAQLPAAYKPHLRLYIGEHEIERRYWARTTPKAGQMVTVRILPAGQGGKNILRAVVMIAVVAAATYLLGPAGLGLGSMVGGGLAGAVVTALAVGAVTFVAQLALNALIPPPKQGNGGEHRPFLTGGQNVFDPYGPIPRVFGKHRVYPKLAAHPYTEIAGNKHYLRMLLTPGYGPLKISDLRIGTTPITAFVGVQVEIHEGGPAGWAGNQDITLYTQQVHETQLSVTMLDLGDTAIQTTEIGCTEIGVDIAFPNGLISYNKKGEQDRRAVEFKVSWRATGSTGAWNDASWIADADNPVQHGNGYLHAEEANQQAILINGRFKVPAGQYDVQVTRKTAKGVQQAGGTNQVDGAQWLILRSVTNKPPIQMDGVCLIAVRIKASDQLNGMVQNLNCIAEAYLPTLADRNSYTLTRSPARAYADILRRRGNETLLPDSRIDIPSLIAWENAGLGVPANDPTGAAWEYNGPIEGGSVFDALRVVAAVGRASFSMRDGKFSVVRDVQQDTPIQHITPRNSWGYSATRTYVDLPHALKVNFLNQDKDYASDQVIVYADGYDATNATPVGTTSAITTIFDTLDLPGCTSSKMAWREGRYHLAIGSARQETHTTNMDVEALRCTIGDRVQLSHDVILVGQAWGRVTSLITSGTSIVGLNVDTQVTFESGKTYQVRIRHADGTSSLHTATAPGGQIGTFTSITIPAIDPSVGPELDDLFMFGETGLESAPMVIKKIEAGEDLSVKLTLVAYNPAILTADTGPIPAFTSYITAPVNPLQLGPPQPKIAVRSDDSVLQVQDDGTVLTRLAVDITPGSSGLVLVAWWYVQYRESGSVDWRDAGDNGMFPFTTTTVYCAPTRKGQDYDVRAKAISGEGLASDWVEIDAHTAIGKNLPPGAPTLPFCTPIYRANRLRWTNPTDNDLDYTEIYSSTANDATTGALIGQSATASYLDDNLDSTLRYYWIRAIDLSGNASPLVFAGAGAPLTLAQQDTDFHQAQNDILTNAGSLAEQLLKYQGQQLLLDARTLINGTSYATIIQQVSDKVDGYAAQVSVIGTSVPGATGFQLNSNVTIAGDDRALSSRLQTTEATLGDVKANTSLLLDAVIDPTGVTTRAVLTLDSNGYFSGFTQTNGGKPGTSSCIFYADKFGVVSSVNGGPPIHVFDIINGELFADSLIVNRLKVGTGGTNGAPTIVAASAQISAGSGVIASTATIVTNGPATILVNTSSSQQFSGNSNWEQQIIINGTQVFDVQGGQIEHSVNMTGALYIAQAGTYVINHMFLGDSSTKMTNRFLTVQIIY
jgi:hypothetical protein